MKATMRSGALTAIVSARGAELISVRDGGGHEWIWPGRQPWARSAPVLFPVIGASGGGSIRQGGKTYPIPMHGFAPDAEFRLLHHDYSTCEFALSASPESRAVYPFDFELRVNFALEGSTLRQRLVVHNPSEQTILVQCGLHPGFAVPSAGTAPIVLFEQEEAAEVLKLRAGHRCEPAPSPVHDRMMEVRPSTFEHGGILFQQVKSAWLWHGGRGKKGILFRSGDFPQLALWTKGAAEFLCIEPWQGAPDQEGFDDVMEEKSNIVGILPRASLTRTCTMEFGAADPRQ
jgi:galactose mutarotase-like enzyme